MTKLGDAYRKVRSLTSDRPSNFGWVLEGKLAGSGMPVTKAEFDWACSQGISAIVTVREGPLPAEWVNDGGIDYLHLQVDDFAAPELEDIDRAVEFIDAQAQKGRPVMVHCAAGKGRTGVILAAYLVKKERLTAQESINKIRAMRPGSIQSEVQEWAIEMYEKYLKSKK
ncbi:MAG TPA: dual specificity protein phosphatase 23 [Nitrososphaera sp.]|nr:dual specificity protein phosphatase 23 [Nitrososphaera sp.]